MLLVGGEDSNAGLEAWARAHFPRAGEVVQRFTAALNGASDLFAFHGGDSDSERSYVSTASWGSITTRSAIAGMVIRDFIDGGDARWNELYVPSACYAGRLEARPGNA